MGQQQDPVTGQAFPLHPRYLGPMDLKTLDRATPDVARGCVVKMVELRIFEAFHFVFRDTVSYSPGGWIIGRTVPCPRDQN